MSIAFLNLRDTNACMEKELEEACLRVIRSGWFLRGPETQEFEKELAKVCRTEYCIGVSNGLDALRLILKGWIELGRLKTGDEVIVPANTYIASILPLTELGLVPLLTEPDETTFCIDYKNAKKHIGSRTKAIMSVHLYGNVAWDEYALDLANNHGLLIIEDNAQAIGAKSSVAGINGTKTTGGLGNAAAHSFYPTKNIGALGDSGAITTNDKELADTVRAIANYGSDRRYHNIYKGWNCRIDEIQAAMLRVKLKKLDCIIKERRDRAKLYDTLINNELVIKPRITDGYVWHQYVVRSKKRDELKLYLEKEGIGCDIHYAVPPHKQPCYKDLTEKNFPITEHLSREILSLPIANVTEKEIKTISEAINNFK